MGKKVKKDEKGPPDDVFDALLVESKQAATVVLMLESPEEEVLTKACEAIYKFVDKCDENKKALLDLNVHDHLLRLIQHEDRVVRRNSAMALGVLASYSEARKLLRKREETIPSVVNLLAPEEDTVVHEFAALCLASLAQDYSCKVSILEQDGLEPLIRCLSSADPDVQKNAVETISLMLKDYQTKSSLRELEGFQPLLALLQSEYPVIQHLALVALERATQDSENRGVMRELEGVDRIIRFIGCPNYSDLHVFAVMVLSNCLEDTETMELVKETGGLQKLKGDADPVIPTLPEVKEHAAKAISRAAKNPDNRKIMHELEVEKMLIHLLDHEEPCVRVAGAQGLGIMSENLTSRDAIGQWEGIEPLIKMLKSDQSDVREASSLALANLTSGNLNNCTDLAKLHGIDPLISLLGDSSCVAIANAAVVLTNMATDEGLRSQIQASGVVTSLIGPLTSENSIVQSKCSLAVAAFLGDFEARTTFRENGGLTPLVQLLHSGNDDVRRSASWAITVCAVDEPTAAEISKLGGLEILQEIQASNTRKNAFTDVAVAKLLDSNLSAKYAITGFLAPNNRICDGFFDAGQIKSGGKLLCLEDYAYMDVNSKRPILLVNAKPEKPSTPIPNPSEIELGDKSSKSSVAGRASRTGREAKGGSRHIHLTAGIMPMVYTSNCSSGNLNRYMHLPRTRSQREREEKQKEEEQHAQQQREAEVSTSQGPFIAPGDPSLIKYIDEVQERVAPLPSTKCQVVALAQFVAEKLGGAIDRGQVANFSWELQLSQLKYDLKSNIIPIGVIKAGIHYHRALLFKALADRIAVHCSLVRGEYNRAWNEVLLTEDDDPAATPRAPKFPPKRFIVDLIHQPGRLMPFESPDANAYQKL
ncbi:hypothetical protein CAPTEDRAFT_165326 [Capitella teleta]|uniref:EDR1/CTR1/ARMC3-like peptidase-like domain-containing protein n=1 Tax=Capitella teleta TaxID=283909 RepID=R7TMD8_CAPTE|nr:hypothetical protein CAPTEDRAFT_165326 [Capitella teleta]|eukprot:ELT95018.1 hypothetical protein CAPTEDRAFT_165326 [Capitella teleta]